MSDTIVRDQKDYESAELARESLPDGYIEYPYAGVWYQQGDSPNMTMYVFSTKSAEVLTAEGWTLAEAAA